MNTERLQNALNGFRSELFDIVKEEVIKAGGSKKIKVELPCDIDEDRYYTITLNCVYLEDGELWVRGESDLYGEEENLLNLYSCDELLRIIQAM